MLTQRPDLYSDSNYVANQWNAQSNSYEHMSFVNLYVELRKIQADLWELNDRTIITWPLQTTDNMISQEIQAVKDQAMLDLQDREQRIVEAINNAQAVSLQQFQANIETKIDDAIKRLDDKMAALAAKYELP